MHSGWGRRTGAGLACATAALLATGDARAQTGPALGVTLDVESSLEIDDNRGLDDPSLGTTTDFETEFGLTVTSETPTTLFGFRLGGTLGVENGPDDDDENGLIEPSIGFDFELRAPETELDFAITLSRDNITDTFLDDVDGDLVVDDLVIDTGRVDDLDVSLDFATGINAPLGLEFSISRSDADYDGTTDPDLFDNTLDDARVAVLLQFSEVATGRVFATWQDYEAADPEETLQTVQTAGVGILYEISPILTFDAEVAFGEVERTETIAPAPRTTRNRDIVVGGASLVRALPAGELEFGASVIANIETTRTTLTASRTFEFPTGEMTLGLGFSDSDTGDGVFLGELAYERALSPTVLVTAALTQEATFTGDDEEVLLTSFALGLLYEVNPQSDVTFDFELGRSDDIGFGTIDETTLTEVTLGYRYELTEDWDWSLAYRARYDDSDSARSNAIITSIERSFSIRP